MMRLKYIGAEEKFFPSAVPDVDIPQCSVEALSDGRVTLAEQLLRHRAKLPQAAFLFVHFLL